MNALLSWSLLPAAALHIVEEFLWPGGFPAWYRKYRPQVASSMTTRFFVIINAVLLVFCAAAGTLGQSSRGVALWLTLAALVAANAWFHLRATLVTKSYSPGLITGLALYVPLATYGYIHALRTEAASAGTAAFALILGCSYQFWADANHRRRAKRASASH